MIRKKYIFGDSSVKIASSLAFSIITLSDGTTSPGEEWRERKLSRTERFYGIVEGLINTNCVV